MHVSGSVMKALPASAKEALLHHLEASRPRGHRLPRRRFPRNKTGLYRGSGRLSGISGGLGRFSGIAGGLEGLSACSSSVEVLQL